MEVEAIKTISIFGAGTMGHGVAQLIAQKGYSVLLGDISQDLLGLAIDRVKKSLQKLAEKGKIDQSQIEETLSRITITIDIEELTRQADFLIEAISEKLDAKKELFRQLDKVCRAETIFATNTSTLSITELASATERPERFIGMHFFNPVPLTGMVEIVKGLLTTGKTTALTRKLVLSLGREPIIVKDSPGFASSRLGVALFLEASRMLAEGVASAEDIDKAMKLGYGHRMGPFETCDLVGLDARLNNINALYEATHDLLWQPPQLLKQLVSAGYLGKKPNSKGGYYTFFGLGK